MESKADHMRGTREIDTYFDLLEIAAENYLIILSVKDTFGGYISDKAFEKIHSFGFSKLSKRLHQMYIGICDKGNMLLDRCGEKPDDPVSFHGEIQGLTLYVTSQSWGNGNRAEIKIDNIDYSLGCRGLNIVVYDCARNIVVDSVTYDSYVSKPVFYHKNLAFDDAYFVNHFFVPGKYMNQWKEPYSKRFYCDKVLRVHEVEEAIILPNKKIENVVYGGVCDKNFEYISGHETYYTEYKCGDRHISGSYRVTDSEMEYVDESVVYGGTMLDHPGHLIAESFADRIWWFLNNPDCCYKVAIVDMWGDGSARFTKEFLELFGISEERVIIVRKPTKFKKVIVPDQSLFPLDGYFPYIFMNEYPAVYKKMTEGLRSSAIKKVYFTKSKTAKGNIVGEDFFIEFYKKKGFEIINPEEHSLREKAEFMYNAEEVVTQIGTNSHYVIFCRPTVKLTLLTRINNNPMSVQACINEAVGIKEVYVVDVSMNFLQKHFSWGVSLMGVTEEFKRYVEAVYKEKVDITPEQSLKDNIIDYCRKVVEYNSDPRCFDFIKNQEMITVLQSMSEIFLGKEFDTTKLNLATDKSKLAEKLEAEIQNLKKENAILRRLCDDFKWKYEQIQRMPDKVCKGV